MKDIGIISQSINCIAVAASKDKIWINPLEVLVFKLKENKLTITLHKQTIEKTHYCPHRKGNIDYISRTKKTITISNYDKNIRKTIQTIREKLINIAQ
jgi:hypothetical protein